MGKNTIKKFLILGIIVLTITSCHKKKKPFLLLPLIGDSPVSVDTINNFHDSNSTNNSTFVPPIGVLDETFQGSGYKIYEDIPYPAYSWDLKSSLLVQSDGKILLGSGNGQFLIARFNTDGSLDNSFNNVGYTQIDIGDGGDWGRSLVFSQNDEVVIGGVCYNSTSADDFCLAKINKTDGSIITYSNLSLTSSNDNAYSITKDNAGNFLISGQCNSDGSYKFCLTRILPNGTNMDTNFGTGTTSTFNGSGFSIFDITESIDDFGENIALQSNEKIIVGGSCNVSWEWKFCIARFHTNGTIDDSFGTNGYVIDSYGLNLSFTSIKIQHDDKILIGGTYNNAFYLLRMNADGKSLDESFGNNGRLFFDIPETTNEELFAIILQPDNAILVAGACSLSPSQEQLCIARFNSNGTIDTTFGEIDPMNSSIRKGYLVVNLNSSFRQIIKTIALQPDGKIVSAGTCIDTSNNHRYCVARFK